MKVLCIDNSYVGLCITVGNWYEISNMLESTYLVLDDKSRWVSLNKKYFKTTEEIREDKLNKLGI